MSMKGELDSFFQAIEGKNSFTKDSFVPSLEVFKKRSSFLLDIIKSTQFQKQHARRLFSSLLPMVENVVENEKYLPSSILTGEERDWNVQVELDEESSRSLYFLKMTALIVQSYLENLLLRRGNESKSTSSQRDWEILEDVYFITEKLHGVMFEVGSLGTEGSQIQKIICGTCETYWAGRFQGKESIVPQLISLLILRTVEEGATKADIKRLWQIKDSLFLLDFSQETISDLKAVILRSLSSPLYLKSVEGRKMISFFFQLDESLIKELHMSMKAQLPLSKVGIAEAFGEIYFRVWKESASISYGIGSFEGNDDDGSVSTGIQKVFEDHVLQDLMYASIHIASPHMAKSICSILDPFLSKKNSPDIERLLYRLYTPILWRALSAANPMVRIHASSTLARVFPLRDPDAGKLHIQEVHERTINAVLTLMRDNDPKVRVAGSDAAINILGVYWDALSSQHIRSLLHEIVMKHAKDNTSSALRAQAVHGITLLLVAEASHGVLRPLLPFIGDLIHDKVEKVRLAVAKLLLKLKQTKGFKYYHVVPSHHILARLAAEGEGSKNPTSAVAAAITDLLSNSYCPLGVKSSEQMRRTLTFLNESPSAAVVFYSNLARFYDATSISKLIVMMIKTLQIRIQQDSAHDQSDSDIDLDCSIVQITLILLKSISSDLDQAENSNCLQFIQEVMGGTTLPDMCVHFEKLSKSIPVDVIFANKCHKICAFLIDCAGFIAPGNRNELVEKLTEQLVGYRDVELTEKNEMNIIPYIAVFCSWGMYEEVAIALSKSILSAFVNEESMISYDSNSKDSRKRKPACEKELSDCTDLSAAISSIPTELSVYLLNKVLCSNDSSCKVVRDVFLSSEYASEAILSSLFQATISAETIISGPVISLHTDDDVKLILSACETYARFAIHKQAATKGPLVMNTALLSLLDWLTKRAIPIICSKRDRLSSSPFKDVNLSVIDERDSMSPCPPSPIEMPPPRRKSNISVGTNANSSFDDMGPNVSAIILDHTESTISVYSLAIHLIRSGLIIFTEWLALGGNDSYEISRHIKAWSQIFSYSFGDIKIAAELFPQYCRICAAVAFYASDYSMMEDAVRIAYGFNKEEVVLALECVKKAFFCFFTKPSDKQKSDLPLALQSILEVAA